MNNLPSLKFGDWYCEVSPQLGMNLLRLTHKGNDILRTPQSPDDLAAEPFHFGTPLLLPANRTKGARFCFRGQEYTLPLNEPQRGNHLHGLMHNAPFEVLEHTEARLVAVYINRDELYPFPFKIAITDSLTEAGYCRELKVENIGGKAMPYTLAYHTAFLEKEFSAPIEKHYEVDENYIPTGNMLPLTEEEAEYVIGTTPKGKTISGSYTVSGHTAGIGEYLYSFSENFDTLVLFNWGGDKGFVCIEPQAGAVNGLNTGKCRILEKGETETYTHKIEFKNR